MKNLLSVLLGAALVSCVEPPQAPPKIVVVVEDTFVYRPLGSVRPLPELPSDSLPTIRRADHAEGQGGLIRR